MRILLLSLTNVMLYVMEKKVVSFEHVIREPNEKKIPLCVKVVPSLLDQTSDAMTFEYDRKWEHHDYDRLSNFTLLLFNSTSHSQPTAFSIHRLLMKSIDCQNSTLLGY